MRVLSSAVRAGGPVILSLALSASPVSAQRVRSPERETMQLVLARICAHEASLPGRDEDDADHDGDVSEWVRRRAPEVVYGTDCAAIHEVLLRGALHTERLRLDRAAHDGRTTRPLDHEHAYIRFAHLYSTRVFTAVETDTNRWAADLRSDGSEPLGWRRDRDVCVDGVCRIVRGPSWARTGRDAWFHVYALAGDLVALTLDDVTTWSPCESAIDDWGGRMDHEHAAAIGLIPISCGPEGATANTFYARPGRVAMRAAWAAGGRESGATGEIVDPSELN